jgi:hypothetical protein
MNAATLKQSEEIYDAVELISESAELSGIRNP